MEAKSEFRAENWVGNQRYTCKVVDILIEQRITSISSFKGVHEENKSDCNVEALWFCNTKVFYFPRGLHSNFPRLTNVTINDCELEEIGKRDLSGLNDLTWLVLQRNNLKRLPDDLLSNTPQLIYINFSGNKIIEMSSKLFQPLTKENLVYANFRDNPSINYCFDTNYQNTTLAALIKKIDANCKPPTNDKTLRKFAALLGNLEELFTSGSFSDFTIKVHGNEHKVHKNILAAQSSVFKGMFTGEGAEEGVKVLKNVKNVSDETFKEFLRFFYTSEVRNEENAMQLFELAIEFDVAELKLECEDSIISSLDESNVLEAYNFGHLQGSEKLKREAFEVIKEVVPDVTDAMIGEHVIINDLVATKLKFDELKLKLKKMFEKKVLQPERSLAYLHNYPAI